MSQYFPAAFCLDLILLRSPAPRSTKKFYNIRPNFNSPESEETSFDSSQANHRVSAQDYQGLIYGINSRIKGQLTRINILRGIKFLFFLALVALLVITISGLYPMAPLFLLGVLFLYTIITAYTGKARREMMRGVAPKINQYLSVINKIKYHPKLLNWTLKFDQQGEYLELDLSYMNHQLVLPPKGRRRTGSFSSLDGGLGLRKGSDEGGYTLMRQ